MFGTFELKIHLGNAAMQTTEDIALALEQQAARIRAQYPSPLEDAVGLHATIRDTNGNHVGSWEVKGEFDDRDE